MRTYLGNNKKHLIGTAKRFNNRLPNKAWSVSLLPEYLGCGANLADGYSQFNRGSPREAT